MHAVLLRRPRQKGMRRQSPGCDNQLKGLRTFRKYLGGGNCGQEHGCNKKRRRAAANIHGAASVVMRTGATTTIRAPHACLQYHWWGDTCLMVADCATTLFCMGSKSKRKPVPTTGIDRRRLLTRNMVLAVAGAASSPCTLALSTYKSARSAAFSESAPQAPQLSTLNLISGTAQHPTAPA